jgi:hypothetical protein
MEIGENMKRLFGVCLIVSVLAMSCASLVTHSAGMSQEDPSYKITYKNIGENRALAIFESYEFRKLKEDEKAKAQMREPKYESIPECDVVFIRTLDWNSTGANPGNWTFIIIDGGGNEIYRNNGGDSFSNLNLGYYGGDHIITSYDDMTYIALKRNAVFPLQLRAVNIRNETIDITISKK